MTIVFCGLIGLSYAQDEATCVAKAPAEVVVNQQFQYTVTTTEKGTVLETDFGKCEFVGGPSMGSSTSISIANGHTEQSTQYTYTYILVCKREGTFTIPGVSISVDGKVIRSNALEIKVVKAGKQSKDNSATNPTDPFRFEWPDFFGGGRR